MLLLLQQTSFYISTSQRCNKWNGRLKRESVSQVDLVLLLSVQYSVLFSAVQIDIYSVCIVARGRCVCVWKLIQSREPLMSHTRARNITIRLSIRLIPDSLE